jgi:hypothetical protein
MQLQFALEGKTVVEIARERGKDPLDAFFDIALEDQLHTEYVIVLFNVHEDRTSYTRQIHLKEQGFFANRIRFLRFVRTARRPGAIWRLGLPQVDLCIDNIYGRPPSHS